jgi:hypothetical protein
VGCEQSEVFTSTTTCQWQKGALYKQQQRKILVAKIIYSSLGSCSSSRLLCGPSINVNSWMETPSLGNSSPLGFVNTARRVQTPLVAQHVGPVEAVEKNSDTHSSMTEPNRFGLDDFDADTSSHDHPSGQKNGANLVTRKDANSSSPFEGLLELYLFGISW